VLLELAACNAAFSVIKEAVQNSGDIMAAGESLFKYFDNKAEIQRKANEKGGSRGSDLEEFMALEKLKQQEEELKQMMIYSGRGGLWSVGQFGWRGTYENNHHTTGLVHGLGMRRFVQVPLSGPSKLERPEVRTPAVFGG